VLTLLWIRVFKVCLTIVGTPQQGALHEEMWFASSYHTEMALRLGALWVAVSSTVQFMLGHSPTKAFQAVIVREMLARFWGVRRAVLALKNSGSRVCDPILGLPDDRVQPTVCPEEAAR
jgi:hypothetical protein